MKKVSTMMIFANLNIAAFDESDQQIPALQKRSVTTLIAENAEREGYDLDGLIIKTANGNWRVRRTEDGWNHELV